MIEIINIVVPLTNIGITIINFAITIGSLIAAIVSYFKNKKMQEETRTRQEELEKKWESYNNDKLGKMEEHNSTVKSIDQAVLRLEPVLISLLKVPLEKNIETNQVDNEVRILEREKKDENINIQK